MSYCIRIVNPLVFLAAAVAAQTSDLPSVAPTALPSVVPTALPSILPFVARVKSVKSVKSVKRVKTAKTAKSGKGTRRVPAVNGDAEEMRLRRRLENPFDQGGP